LDFCSKQTRAAAATAVTAAAHVCLQNQNQQYENAGSIFLHINEKEKFKKNNLLEAFGG
jgi:hypothetical protein